MFGLFPVKGGEGWNKLVRGLFARVGVVLRSKGLLDIFERDGVKAKGLSL